MKDFWQGQPMEELARVTTDHVDRRECSIRTPRLPAAIRDLSNGLNECTDDLLRLEAAQVASRIVLWCITPHRPMSELFLRRIERQKTGYALADLASNSPKEGIQVVEAETLALDPAQSHHRPALIRAEDVDSALPETRARNDS